MYNKLFTKILDSSIWLEADHTRIVWITFIAAMDEDGFASFGSIQNIAKRANVTPELAEKAVQVLESPDVHNPKQDHDGRRIERVDGGWMVLNSAKYREMVNRVVAREKTRDRVANWRKKRKDASGNADVTVGNTISSSSSSSSKSSSKSEKKDKSLVASENDATANGTAVVVHSNGKRPARVTRTPDDVVRQLGELFVQIQTGEREKMSKDDQLRVQAEMVFLYWTAKFDHFGVLMDPKRISRIVARLKENDGDMGELLYALDGAHADDQIMGRGKYAGEKRYDGIETIFRERGQVERFANARGAFKRGEPHPRIAKLEAIARGEVPNG